MVPYERPWELYRGLITAADLIWPVCLGYSIIFFPSPRLLVYIIHRAKVCNVPVTTHYCMYYCIVQFISPIWIQWCVMAVAMHGIAKWYLRFRPKNQKKKRTVDNKKDPWIP